MKIAIFTDANQKIGAGHYARCLLLADLAKDKGHQVHFISSGTSKKFFGMIENAGYPLTSFSGDFYSDNEFKNLVTFIESHNFNFAIIDMFLIGEQWEHKIRPYFKQIMAVVDLADQKHDVDIIMNQNQYHGYQTSFDSLVPKECKKLLGTKYFLFRKEFQNAAETATPRQEFKKVLVNFGGTDPTNQVEKTLDALSKFNLEVTAILGNNHIAKEQIYQKYADDIRYQIMDRSDNISKHFLEADIAVSAAGISAWERAYLGLPSVIIAVSDRQVEVAKYLDQQDAAQFLGLQTDVSESDIVHCLTNLTDGSIQKMSKNCRGFFTKVSRENVAEEIGW